MGKRTVVNACVTDIEKRREPSKHYVYIIHVTWSDGAVNVIYRRYSSFFDFQVKLLGQFPDEAGSNNPSARCIPFLPGKKLFGRSHIREVALKRLNQLDEYCQALVKLPSKISDSKQVIDFFTPSPEDVSPPSQNGEPGSGRGADIDSISEPIQAEQYLVVADYKKQQKNEVDLTTGDLVEVFEKNDNGWWFVTINDHHGWAPGTFLQKPDGNEEEEETLLPGNDESYITNNAYKAGADDEISFETGVVVTILQKSLDGWWLISYQGKQGWAPATFLQIYKGPVGVTAKPPTQSIGNVMLLKNNFGSDSRPSPPVGARPGGLGSRPLPPPVPQSEPDDSGQIYTNFDISEPKPTPPRRATVRRSFSSSSSHDTETEKSTNLYNGENTARGRGARNPVKPAKPAKASEYYAISSFQGAANDGSLSFSEGDKVEVVEENDGGWWLVKIKGEEGWAPSTYIEKREVAAGSSRSNGKLSALGSLDEETGEEKGPPSLPTRPSFGSGGAFKPLPKTKSTPPPVDRSNSPSFGRRAASSSSSVGGGGGGNDFMSAMKKQFEKTSVSNSSSSPAIPSKPFRPVAKPAPCSPSVGYVTTSSYDNDEDDGLSFQAGERVEVVKKDDSGWWLVKIGAREGWAPSTFLEMS